MSGLSPSYVSVNAIVACVAFCVRLSMTLALITSTRMSLMKRSSTSSVELFSRRLAYSPYCSMIFHSVERVMTCCLMVSIR